MSVNERLEKVRQEIIQLLQAQLEALADLSNLSDAQLAACYTRHERIRELRDRLVLLGDNWNSLEAAEAAAPPVVIGEAAVAEL